MNDALTNDRMIRPAGWRYDQAVKMFAAARDAGDAMIYAVAARVCKAVRLGRLVAASDLAALDAFSAA